MEDIGNILYYIVIFVIALVSWLSSSTKKKSQQQTNSPSPFPTQEMSPKPSPPPVKRQKTVPPPAPNRTRQQEKLHSTLSSKYIIDTPIMLEEEISLVDELDLTNQESFRKAVIYTEILKRKY